MSEVFVGVDRSKQVMVIIIEDMVFEFNLSQTHTMLRAITKVAFDLQSMLEKG